MPLDYLFTAANGMASELYRYVGEPEQRSLAVAAAIGCNAMTDWSEDRAFREIVRSLAIRQRIDAPVFGTAATSRTVLSVSGPMFGAANFPELNPGVVIQEKVEEFLRLEVRILMANGLSNNAAERVVYSLREQIASLRDTEVNPPAVFAAIEELRDIACEEAFRTAERERSQRQLERVFRGLCGGALIVANETLLAASLGLSHPLSILSGVMGGALIQRQ